MAPVLNDVEQNLATMTKMVEDICLQQKVDLIVFPELCTTGFECGVEFANLAERIDDHTVHTMSKRATEYDTYIAFGFAEKLKVESVVYSAAVLLNPDGEVCVEYQQVHLKGEQRLAFRPGYRFPVAETRFGRVGLLVGWDLAFPEAARSLALDGAEIICLCANWEAPETHEWRSLGFARALENSVFVAAANRVGQEPTYAYLGESMIVGPRGSVHARLAESEPGVAIATIDLDQVRRYQDEIQLLQGRQPRSYRAVVRMY
jgi:predicted amidohydrolase